MDYFINRKAVTMYIDMEKINADVNTYLTSFAEAYVRYAQKELTEVARRSIIDFYRDPVFDNSPPFRPAYYKRTGNLARNSYSSYYKNNGRVKYGGVRIHSNNMKEVYDNASAFEVAILSYVGGIHGHPSAGIVSKQPPLDKIRDFHKSKKFRDSAFEVGMKAARAQSYTYMKL